MVGHVQHAVHDGLVVLLVVQKLGGETETSAFNKQCFFRIRKVYMNVHREHSNVKHAKPPPEGAVNCKLQQTRDDSSEI